MSTKLRRSVVALATTLACLALLASPASATNHGGTITSGTIDLVAGSTLSLPWAGTAGTGCGHTFVIDETATTYEVTSYVSRSRGTLLGTPFVAVVTRTASTAGGVSGTTLTSSATLGLQIEFFSPLNGGTATDCATNVRRCGYTVTLHLGGAVTGWTVSSPGTLGYPSAALAVVPTCAVPFATWITGDVGSGGFSFHVDT